MKRGGLKHVLTWSWAVALLAGCAGPSGDLDSDDAGDSGGDGADSGGPVGDLPDSPVPDPSGTGLLACPTDALPEYTGSRADPAEWTEAELQEAIDLGLEVWRTADDDGKACADCHGVDGLDLAVIAFPDEDIRRRGSDHVDDESVERVVDMVHAWRNRYGIDEPCRVDWRVFQPSGETLPGSTPLEREVAFGQQLEELGYLLVSPEPPANAQDAYALYGQLVNAPVRQIPLPIPLPRWSDDHLRGEEWRNPNDWITDHGVVPKAEHRDAWYELADEYIADPSEANLVAIVESMEEMVEPLPLLEDTSMTRFVNKLNEERLLTALHAGHMFRMAVEGGVGWLEYGPIAYDTRYDHRYKPTGEHSQLGGWNPYLALQGVTHLGQTPCDEGEWPDEHVKIECLGAEIPPGMADELETFDSIWDSEAFGSFSSTWGVLGWLFDAQMMETPRHSNDMKYWKGQMRRADYNLTLIWMRATSLSLKFGVIEPEAGPRWEVPEGLDPTLPILDGRWWRDYFVSDYGGLKKSGEDGLAAQRSDYAMRASLNMHTMVLLIMDDLLANGAAVNVRDELLPEFDAQMGFLAEYPIDGERIAAVEALTAQVRQRILDAENTEIETVY